LESGEKAGATVAAFSTWSNLSMKAIKTYPTRVEADLAKIALDAAGVPSVVVGVGVGMEGGVAGVQLLVPDDRVEAALRVLKDA
jgi:putative signal transducing protein